MKYCRAPRASRPEDVGLSSARLAKLAKVTQEHVDSGLLPGAVILIARRGKIADYEPFGFRERDKGLAGSVGEYGWAGNAGTLFWIDPKEQLIALYMIQVSDPDRIALRNQFRTMVIQSIVD